MLAAGERLPASVEPGMLAIGGRPPGFGRGAGTKRGGAGASMPREKRLWGSAAKQAWVGSQWESHGPVPTGVPACSSSRATVALATP